MTPLLSLDDVCKRYGALTVTDEVSLAVAPGEALGILGPNGAGKTSLSNLMWFLLPSPAGGRGGGRG